MSAAARTTRDQPVLPRNSAERKGGSIRRHLLATVLMLVAAFPLCIFAFTWWINRTSAVQRLDARLQDSVENAFRLRNAVELALAMAVKVGDVKVQPSYSPLPDGTAAVIYETCVTPAFKQKLEEIEPGDKMLDFATLLDSRGDMIASSVEQAKLPRQGQVQVRTDDSPRSLVRRVLRAAREGGQSVITLAFPTRIGEQIAGTLVVGLSFRLINLQIQQEVHGNNLRALSISLAGSLLLAASGMYLLKLSERARRLQSALEREKHLAHIGTLSAGLAHEIRNPLSSVKMNAQMIRDRLEKAAVDDRDVLLRKIERVETETARLEESLNDFLAFAAPRPLNLEAVDVNAVVRSVAELLQPAAGGAALSTRLHEPLPAARLDRGMLTEMLQNLVINALHAAGAGGSVEVATGLEGGRVRITVSDSGPGVPEGLREKVFEAFYTTKKSGTGLGLSIAHRIAESHGGTIRAGRSALGGAEFAVVLPLDARQT